MKYSIGSRVLFSYSGKEKIGYIIETDETKNICTMITDTVYPVTIKENAIKKIVPRPYLEKFGNTKQTESL